MQLGKTIEIPVTSLGNKKFTEDLGDSDIIRRVKVYLVPAVVSESRVQVMSWGVDCAEIAPVCRVKDVTLLADYTLAPDGDVVIRYLHQAMN
jgi:hypothetical protein